jgi:transmembrane sensor
MNATPGSLTVSVAEGHVSVGGNQAPASRLAAGQQLVAARGKSAAQIRNVAPGDVGSWRQGRLVYDNTPLEVVAADLTRYSGKTVTVDPTLHDTKFSGVLAIGDGSRLVQNLAAIMSIASKADGDTIRLVAAPAR